MTTAEFDKLVPVHYGTKTILVDPDLGQRILDKYNTGNRRLSSAKVSKLASQFARGEYENERGSLEPSGHLRHSLAADHVVKFPTGVVVSPAATRGRRASGRGPHHR